MAVTCKKCKTEMDKIFCFYDYDRTPYQQWRCSQCGATTAKRTIEYDDEGNIEKKGGKVLND